MSPKKKQWPKNKAAQIKKTKPVAKTAKKKEILKTSKIKGNVQEAGSVSDEKKDKKAAAKLSSLALIRGMKDLLPQQSELWTRIYHTAEAIAKAYEYTYIETPIVEQASLFVRSLGKGTDVVEKEMYIFEDADGSKVCLRPELTAAVARAYIMHGMQTLPQPVKMWNWGPMFRHNRPQAGRYREFHQFDCEHIGEHSPVVDAELISVAYNTLRDLGIESTVRVNSIGTLADREQYVVELSGYLKSKRSYLSEQSKKRMHKNPLRVLDSNEEEDIAIIAEAPEILDWLSEESKRYFMSVLEYLDAAEIPYVLTPTLVRGLDYYTDTVFEIVEDNVEKSAQSSLAGGGRYNGLIELLGGAPTPAAGFAMGIERVYSALQKKAKQEETLLEVPKKSSQPVVFFAQLGEQARKRALYLLEQLRRDGISVYHNLAKSSLKAQLESANKRGVTHALILGQKEVQDSTILIRDMESGIQEVVDQGKLKHSLRKLLHL